LLIVDKHGPGLEMFNQNGKTIWSQP
jgi:hypothetical protein